MSDSKSTVAPESHFESMERQRLASTFGMAVFLASEVLFFGGLFTMFASYRAQAPEAFSRAVAENTLYWGSANTCVLLTSSLSAVLAVHELRQERSCAALGWISMTIALGSVFLFIKGFEYLDHFHHGIYPGGHGHWFSEKGHVPATAAFWSLYYVMTGLHAIHVSVGILALMGTAILVARRKIVAAAPQTLENVAMYWHLVDIIWLFLWPLFYLTRGGH